MKINQKLTFSFEFNTTPLHHQEYIYNLFVQAGATQYNHGGLSIDLDSSEFIPLIKQVLAYKAEHSLEYSIKGGIQLHLQEDATTEWYVLRPVSNIADAADRVSKNSVPLYMIKGCNAPEYLNVGDGRGALHVSEKFVKLSEKENWSGVEYIWVIDKGKYASKQWYTPVSQQALGRGVDHQWFQSRDSLLQSTLKGSGAFQPIGDFRTGVFHFSTNQVKTTISTLNPTNEVLFKFLEKSTVNIYTFKSYQRKYLPDTDFAYIWRDEDLSLRRRQIVISRRVKDALIKHNLIARNDVEPILIVDSSEGQEDLDALYPDNIPLPIYLKDEIAYIQPELQQAWAKHISSPKPQKPITEQAVKTLMRQYIFDRKSIVNKGLIRKKAQTYSGVIPTKYLEFLSLMDGGALQDTCNLLSAENIITYSEKLHTANPNNSTINQYLVIGTNAKEDLFCCNKNDNKIYLIEIKTNSITKIWDSYEQFFYDMLVS